MHRAIVQMTSKNSSVRRIGWQETIALIQKALQTRGVIVFTDPDFPGTRIRNIIQERVPGVKHAFIERAEAVRKDNHKSLGVEHASTEAIQRALESVHEISTETGDPVISQATLMALGFIGRPDSATRRQKVADFLKIGHTNGKQFAKRLQKSNKFLKENSPFQPMVGF